MRRHQNHPYQAARDRSAVRERSVHGLETRFSARARHRWALTWVEVLVVLAALALVALVLAPALVRAKAKAQRISCISNLKIISLSFRIWAGDQTNLYPMQVAGIFGGTKEYEATADIFRHFQVLSNELATPYVLVCPADRSHRRSPDFHTNFSNANISYFLGLDATEDHPDGWLAGDSNLEVAGQPVQPGLLHLWTNSPAGWTAERHGRCGNLALADGSVQQLTNAKVREMLSQTGMATNRLAIP